ncbi:MAG: hypothetical protein PHQ58_19640 [Rhodoferax sp.]|uniref:hypothetical protein n=1 Tax=Rhodoferax sp. TaxID=50421 RepID=UPI0026192BBC|nr:hypothetical protein [Rhodoferax sp.]MDD2882640.1 hypothetical protein [Rhodoferax sp.]
MELSKPNRAHSTEAAYIANSKYLVEKIRRDNNKTSIDEITCEEILHHISLLRQVYRVDAWRFAKASIVNLFERALTYLDLIADSQNDLISEEAINEELNELEGSIFHLKKFKWSDASTNVGKSAAQRSKELPEKNGSGKQKLVNADFLFRIEQYIKEGRSIWQHRGLKMCIAILYTGLRPCEWEHARIEEDESKFQLVIPDFKNQTGGERTVSRKILITGADACDAVRQQVESINQWKKEVGFENSGIDFNKKYLALSSNGFRVAQIQLFGENKGVTPYSFRYQCASNVKAAGYSVVVQSKFLGKKNKGQASSKVVIGQSTPRSRKKAATVAKIPTGYAKKFMQPVVGLAISD